MAKKLMGIVGLGMALAVGFVFGGSDVQDLAEDVYPPILSVDEVEEDVVEVESESGVLTASYSICCPSPASVDIVALKEDEIELPENVSTENVEDVLKDPKIKSVDGLIDSGEFLTMDETYSRPLVDDGRIV